MAPRTRSVVIALHSNVFAVMQLVQDSRLWQSGVLVYCCMLKQRCCASQVLVCIVALCWTLDTTIMGCNLACNLACML